MVVSPITRGSVRADGRRTTDLRQGLPVERKGRRDENFPVASLLVAPAHRAAILAFYRFARAADDIADHPSMGPGDKRARLAAMRSGLDGTGPTEAMALGAAMAERGLDPVHAHDLLTAFEIDVVKRRYTDWDDLIGYCRLSAMPVGRFFLDLHGEGHVARNASDAVCAALQVINHLQDCGSDFRTLDRIYLPADVLREHGVRDEDLAADRGTPALQRAVGALASQAQVLLVASRPIAELIRDRRLAAEVAVVQALGENLAGRLSLRDPLSERVRHTRFEAGALALSAALPVLLRRRR